MKQETTQSVDVLQCRAILYAGISTVFSSTVEEKFQSMHHGEIRNQIIEAAAYYDDHADGNSPNVHQAAVGLIDAFESEKKTLEYEYVNIFGHTLSKKTSPYELEHLQNQEIFYKTQSLADISGFYKAFGLQIRANERADFISIEAEFLSYLIVKELLARQKELGDEKIDVTRNAQRDFFKDHFAGWASKLAKNVIEQARISFYQQAGRYLQRFIKAETLYLRKAV